MAKIIVIYYSQTGNTKKMAQLIGEGAQKQGAAVTVKDVKEVGAQELLEYDGIVMGSPTYYGTMAYQLKKLLDESVRFHGSLEGKVGGAFASSANIAGGNETTVLDILNAMLIHGMIIHGDPEGDHYGPVAIGTPDARAGKECRRLGERMAKLAARLAYVKGSGCIS